LCEAVLDQRLVALLEDPQRHDLAGQRDESEREEGEVAYGRARHAAKSMCARACRHVVRRDTRRRSDATAARSPPYASAMTSTAIVWLRRDLRLHDHPPLARALAVHDRVIPVFVLDPVLLHGRFASAPRTAFLLDCLRELDAGMRERGGGLVIRHGQPARELCELAAATRARAVYWSSDATPYAHARDRRVRAALAAAGVEAVSGPGTFVADVDAPR